MGVCSRYVPEGFQPSAFAADYHLPLLPQTAIVPRVTEDESGFTVALTAEGDLCMIAAFLR